MSATIKGTSYGSQAPNEPDPNRNYSAHTVLRNLRCPRALDEKIQARVRKTGLNWSQVVIGIIERGLKGLK